MAFVLQKTKTSTIYPLKIPMVTGVIGSTSIRIRTWSLTSELNQSLEIIAQLIEANAKDAKSDAEIVRSNKVKA